MFLPPAQAAGKAMLNGLYPKAKGKAKAKGRKRKTGEGEVSADVSANGSTGA